MAAAAILEKFRMAISPQRLTIYLYSAHRAVIFAIAQLSCYDLQLKTDHKDQQKRQTMQRMDRYCELVQV